MQLSPSVASGCRFKGVGSDVADFFVCYCSHCLFLVFYVLFSTLCPSSFAIILMGKRGLVALL